ncbi:hypothetical protein MBLNU457_3736t1 [Dothideomycetes sp. NU457]
MHFHHIHSHLRDAVISSSSASIVNVASPKLMARQNDPFPHTTAGTASVGDFGILANLTGDRTRMTYAYGLAGVDQDSNYLFAACLGFTLAAFCALTLLFRLARMSNAHFRHLLTLGNPDRQRYWSQNHTTWWPKIKQHLLYAPLFRVRHNKEIQLSRAITIGTLPSRFHSLLLFVYLASNLAYILVLAWHKENSAAVIAELRGRSGELAALNLMPTIIFALRNNPLIPILRVSYDTFNLFHRWCARVVVVEVIIHTACYLVNVAAGGHDAIRKSLATSSSYQWGMVATCTLVVIIIQSASPIRHAFYELFINMHRVLVVLALVGTYLHIERANLPQLPYIRAVFVLYGFEWFMRLWRTIHYNWSLRAGTTKVTVEALPAEACRVTFHLAKPWHGRAGSHVHVYLPAIGWLSSHPFSVAWVETNIRKTPVEDVEKQAAASDTPQRRDSTYKLPVFDTTVAAGEPGFNESSKSAAVSSVSLIIRARTGMTRHLYNKAAASPNGTIAIRGALEGPYGGHESLSSYGTVVLFAGGVGITHCISYISSLLQEYAEGTCSCRRILLVWSVPNTEALEWVRPWMDQILRMEGRKDVLRIQLFITKPRHQTEIKSNTGSVQMFPGRCNPATVIDKEVAERVGAMGVVVCGPGAFADSVRAATRSKAQVGSIDFIEEAFTY